VSRATAGWIEPTPSSESLSRHGAVDKIVATPRDDRDKSLVSVTMKLAVKE